MLIGIDSNLGTVTLYGENVRTVSISQFEQLRPYLSGHTVQYIQQVVEVDGDDIIATLQELSSDPNVPKAPVMPLSQRCSNDQVVSKPVQQANDGRMWMYATGSGYLNIEAIHLRFDGPADFRDISRIGGMSIFEREPILKTLLEKGKIKVSSTAEMGRIKKQVAKDMARKEDMRLRNSDGSSIIVDTVGGRIKNQPAMSEQFEDVTTDDPDDNFLSEQAKLIRDFGFGKPEDEGDDGATGEQEAGVA